MTTLGDFIRTLVRPGVTFGLGAATVERVIAGDLDGAKFLGTFFGIAMTFWFVDRATTADGTIQSTTTTTTPGGTA